jgi:predicted outer membrane protein
VGDPSGEWAEKRGASEQTRIVGKLIAADHRVLDDDVKRVAGRFTYTLPTKPTADQQMWLDEMQAAKGKDFDRIFAQRLHFAHGPCTRPSPTYVRTAATR